MERKGKKGNEPKGKVMIKKDREGERKGKGRADQGEEGKGREGAGCV